LERVAPGKKAASSAGASLLVLSPPLEAVLVVVV
jgi:hypothetical protein